MVLRAKFENLEEQKEFFISVKNKLGMGATRLANRLGLSSRGCLEKFTAARTAPPVWIIEKLSALSEIKPSKFEVVKTRVCRNKRRFLSMSVEESERILLNKFGEDVLRKIKLMSEDGKNIEEICSTLRRQGFTFDTSKIGGAIGTLKKNILLPLVDEMSTDNCVILHGNVALRKGEFSILFSCPPLAKLAQKNKIRVGIRIAKDLKSIAPFPLKIGRVMGVKFGKGGSTLGVSLPQSLNLENKSKINVIINPADFGLEQIDFIQDKDGKALGKTAREMKIEIEVTNLDNNGDVVFKINNKKVIVEVTRAKSWQISRLKIGQCFIQSMVNPNAQVVLVCRKDLFGELELKALENIKVFPIFTNFKNGWDTKVLKELLKCLDNK